MTFWSSPWFMVSDFLAAGALLLVLVNVVYALVALFLSRRPTTGDRTRRQPLGRASDKLTVFLIPCLNEARVIGASIDRLRSLPEVNWMVMVVDDGSDDGTADIVESYADSRVHLLRRSSPFARQGKGEALNAGYRHLIMSDLLVGLDPRDVVVTILDADGRLDAQALSVVLPRFADKSIGGVQIGVRINNRTTNWLARMQDMEFVIFTDVFQRARRHLRSVGLGGNGQFMRLAALMSLGNAPWSKSLTEDLDLGIRLMSTGWTNEYLNEVAVHQQGIVDLRRLVRQRTRWFQGHLQAWNLLPAIIRHTTGARRRDLQWHLLAPLMMLVASLLTVAFLLTVVAVALHSVAGTDLPAPWWLLTAYALGFFPALTFSWVYWRRERENGLSRFQALLLAHTYVGYCLMWYLAGWRAAWRSLLNRNAWAKTERLVETEATLPPERHAVRQPVAAS